MERIIIEVNGKTKSSIDPKAIKSKEDLMIEWMKALNNTENVTEVLDLVSVLDKK